MGLPIQANTILPSKELVGYIDNARLDILWRVEDLSCLVSCGSDHNEAAF